MMNEGQRLGAEAARRLADTGLYAFEPGLSDAEFARIEREHGFEFADDHRAFLAAGLPVNVPPEEGQTWSKPWPEWRDAEPDELRSQLDWPVEGVLLSIEHSAFWYEPWGERPTDDAAALATARCRLENVPILVPVYAHRYLPAGRGSFGHPVLSMWQTDIIYYGQDLVDYMHQEFDDARGDVDASGDPQASVGFWQDLI
ncbi:MULTISPECIES: hypothetical protein [unclassified Streptomyces]|uniref:hypothetical protein n=1 Tax=unclassified Streptomyces TaxID=2593676 RepID=UPI002DD7A2CC|nr:hypothetical protein [Streptomyces sp. NBC_01257]WRZ64632.1 hypothetical protein OG408_12370 [Streptomyces sp. NBC_01257]WSU58603.1 hypothetical protein OG450_12360 [Streptomyces sp. NBC_01104]